MLTIRSYAAPISEPRLRGSAGTFTRNSVRPRGTSPIKTLSDPNVYPNDVTICPNGTVYAANYYGMSQIAGNVVAYAKGSLTPTRTLAWPGQGIDRIRYL